MEPVTNQNAAGTAIGDKVDPGLRPKQNPTVGKDCRAALPHAIVGIDVDSSNGKPNKRKNKNQAPIPPVSGATRWIVLTGAVFALICAEAWSAPTLFSLAEQAKAPKQLAWLLPAVLDCYAATAIWFGNSVPKAHPIHGEAIANTRLALLITVACNGVFHLLALAGKDLPAWVPIALLVTVTALPIYITDRLVRMYKLADGGTERFDAAPERGTEKPAAPAAKKAPASGIGTERTAPASGSEQLDSAPRPVSKPAPAVADTGTRSASVVDINGSGRISMDIRARKAVKIYRQHIEDFDGLAPSAATLAALLRKRHPELKVPEGDRSERILRSKTEDFYNDPDFVDDEDVQPDTGASEASEAVS